MESKCDLSHIIINKKCDHIEIAKTSRQFTYLSDGYRIPHKFCGNFMRQQLDLITACNQLGLLSGAH